MGPNRSFNGNFSRDGQGDQGMLRLRGEREFQGPMRGARVMGQRFPERVGMAPRGSFGERRPFPKREEGDYDHEKKPFRRFNGDRPYQREVGTLRS
jgi:hypothetical protein